MTLSAGDFAFVGYNANGNDDFAIVLLTDISSSETVYFTDTEWLGSALAAGETTLTWTTGAPLSAGTIIRFSNVSNAASPTHGTVSGNLSLTTSGDSILAYQGTAGSPTSFVAGLAYDETGFAQSGGTLSGTGLTEGTHAVAMPTSTSHDGGAYTGDRASGASFSDYLSLINNNSNWTVVETNGTSLLPFSATAFQTGGVDAAPPIIASVSPSLDAEGVAVGANLQITFNEDVQKGSGNIQIRLRSDDSVVETIAVTSGSVSVAGPTATINPTADLDQATRYYVTVDSGAFEDTTGNDFAGISDKRTLAFGTELPAIGAAPAGLGAGSLALVGFNTEGQTDDLAFVALEDLDGSTTPFQIFITDNHWNGTSFNANGDGTLIWTIDELIPAGTVINFNDIAFDSFSLTSDTGASVGYMSLNGYVGLSSSGDAFYVYVGSLGTPRASNGFLTAVATDSVGFTGADGVLTNTGLTEGSTAANFGALEDGLDGAAYQGARSGETDFADYLSALNGAPLSTNWTTLNDTGDGDSLSPFSETAFSISGVDLTPPNLASTSPADESSNVAVGANLTATFNENVQVGTGNIRIYNKVGDTLVETIDVTSGQVSVSGATVTINPTSDLDPAATYYVQMDAGAVEDAANNDFAGISDETTWNFTTALPSVSVPTFSAGDIAFTGFNGSIPEDLSFVALTDMDGSSTPFQVFFTDQAWTGAAFAGGEGTLIWTVTSEIKAGTVVTFTDINEPTSSDFGASVGLLQEDGAFDIRTSGDVVVAYTGSLNTPSAFLSGFTSEETGFAYDSGTLTGTGLVEGQTAVNLSDGSTDPAGGQYNGNRYDQGSFADYLPIINNRANWSLEDSSGASTLPLSVSPFGVLPSVTLLPGDLSFTEDTAGNVALGAAVFADP
ncbi:Ig-like domain-containing protein, partial [Falsiruegeria litorea]|uniref:Ig-like domain-containing protein n=1 Tax=Falsiruegeria litorea TaxID=1280831 RepID=UPI001BFEB7BD